MDAVIAILAEVDGDADAAAARDRAVSAVGASARSWSVALEPRVTFVVRGVDTTTRESFSEEVDAAGKAEAEAIVLSTGSGDRVIAHVEPVAPRIATAS